MSEETTIEQANRDEAQWVVLGTLFDGNLDPKQALRLAREVADAGGIELFDAEWSCELWRRAAQALKAGKPPARYVLLKQVETVPMDMIGKLGDSVLPISFSEQTYLPELCASARERKIRRAMREAVEGGNIDKALHTCREAQRIIQKEKTKPDICNEALDDWTEALKRPGQISGITSGLIDLDRLTWGWQNENLIIIGARPSQGKTALLLTFARTSAVVANIPTLFITLESSQKELMKRLACQIARANQTDLRGGQPTERDMINLGPAFSKISAAPIYFADCSGMSITGIQSVARRLAEDFSIRIILVDYLQKIKPAERHEKRTYEVAQSSEGLKILAKELNLPVIAAAQLNREPEKQKGRQPVLSDLADSGQIERDADLVALLHKDKKGGMWLLLSKFRDGPTGVVKLQFIPAYAAFESASRIDD